MLLLNMFSRRWLLATILVFFGTALCIRLGIWQLDRLDQRRVFNNQVETMRALPPMNLNADDLDSIETMEWRAVTISGEYDFENQVAIRNRYYRDRYGYHLLTPLRFDAQQDSRQGEMVILIDRGWIPADGNSAQDDWRKYDDLGVVAVKGQIRLGQGKPAFGGVADAIPTDGSPLWIWNNGDIEKIALQLPYPILNVYIQPVSNDNDDIPPIPYQPTVELTEGSHFGYALQWFTFAAILFVGYPFYLRKQEA